MIGPGWCSPGLEEEPLHARRWIVVDTETTGLDPSADSIVEFAAIILDEECKQIAIRHWVDRDNPEMIAKVTHFVDRVLADGILVAHNLAFDTAFLARDEHFSESRLARPSRWLCTMRATGAFVSLDRLAKQTGVVMEQRHSALGDAQGLASILSVISADARSGGAEHFGAVRQVIERRLIQSGGLPVSSGNPWPMIIGSLPRIAPVPFPSWDQRAVFAAVIASLDSDGTGRDNLNDRVERAIMTLSAANLTAISVEQMLADQRQAPIDT